MDNEEFDINMDENTNVLSKEAMESIKRKSYINSEGDEAIGDFTYDAMFNSSSDDYRDY